MGAGRSRGDEEKSPVLCPHCGLEIGPNGFRNHYLTHFKGGKQPPEDEITAARLEGARRFKAWKAGIELDPEGVGPRAGLCPMCGFVGGPAELVRHLVEAEGLDSKRSRGLVSDLDRTRAAPHVLNAAQRHQEVELIRRLAELPEFENNAAVAQALAELEQSLAKAIERLTPRDRGKP